MASSEPVHADKVVIVTGPTVGAVMSFLVIGAAFGAAGAFFAATPFLFDFFGRPLDEDAPCHIQMPPATTSMATIAAPTLMSVLRSMPPPLLLRTFAAEGGLAIISVEAAGLRSAMSISVCPLG